MEFVQEVSDKTATMHRSIVLVAYPIHSGLLKCSVVYRRLLLEKGLTLVGLLPAKRAKCKESDPGSEGVG